MKHTSILLNADAGESGGGDVDPILMNDQSDTSTAMPLLPKDEYRLQIVKITQERNKADTGNYLKIQLKTMDDATAVSGEPIHPGFPLFHNISITPTSDYTQSSINRALKQLMVAAGFDSGAFYPLERYEGKIVKANVKINKATTEFEESNGIARFIV